MRECKFNVAHIFPAPEIEYHERNCDDRLHVVKFMEGRKRIAQTDDKTKDEKAQKKAKVDSSDDEWDDHDHVSLIRYLMKFLKLKFKFQHKAAEPIDRRRKVEESKTHIVHFEHMTKSLRNAAREERHQRITQQEKAEKEKE